MNFLKYFLIGFLVFHAVCAFSSSEQIIRVDCDNGNDLKSGLSWDQAKKNVQTAIDAAHIRGISTQVWVKRGTYCESLTMKSNVSLYGGFAGNERLLSERNIQDNRTIIDSRSAKSEKPIHHVIVMDGCANAIVDGFVITGGEARGEDLDANGAGILCVNLEESCSISNCMIVWNKAKRYGGGIYWSPDSQPNIANCVIILNSAFWGGGVFCGGGPKPAFQSCMIKNNSAIGDDSKGGGVYSTGRTRFVQCTFSSNISAYGGGVYCYQKSVFEKCLFIQNIASYGAGVYSREEIEIDRCTFSGNSAFQGGALRLDSPGSVIKNSILWKNSGGSVSYSKVSPEVRFSCIEGGFPGTGNISSDPELIGWGSLTDLYIDGKYKGQSDGSKDKPFPNIGRAIECFNFYLSDKSPCLKTAEHGADMGANHEVWQWTGNKLVTFHLAPGEYDTSFCTFDWNVSLEGAGTEKTVLVGSVRGLRSGRHIKNLKIAKSDSSALVIPENENPTVENCVITGNKTLEFGGGITLGAGSNADFTNCLIQGNSSKKRGGAVYCDEKTSGTFYGCVIRENISGSDAGGIYLAPLSKVRFVECTIEDNMTSHDGGAFYSDKDSEPLFQKCLIQRNTSHMGGGGWCAPASFARFLECRFLTNHAAYGAGIYNNDSRASFDRCLFAFNNSWYGGGVYLFLGSNCRFKNCDIRFNRATSGGGIYCYRANPYLEYCVIEGNDSGKDGGGVFCFEAEPRMNHCEIISNNAARGGAVVSHRNGPILANCIVWDNYGAQIEYDLKSPQIRYSCIESGWEGTGNISTEPGFVGWGQWKDVYIDAATTIPLERTRAHPFADIKSALSLYNPSLGKDSPCLGSGENRTDMGSGRIAEEKRGNTSVTFHIAPGKYDLSDSHFLKYVSLEGAGMDKTVLQGSVRGLRSGCSLKRVTITSSRSSGLHIGSHQNPLVENCLITGNLAGPMNFNGAGVYCGSYSSPRIYGCIISRNGVVESFPGTGGAGIFCDSESQPRFQRCRIEDNRAGGNAAGVYCLEARPVFECCAFTGNVSGQNGGTLFCDGASPRFFNCIFSLNASSLNGGALYCINKASPLLRNCVLAGNQAEKDGSAIYLFRSKPAIENSIIWNHPGIPFSLNQSSLVIEYSDVEGGFDGQGNINADPFFVSPGSWTGIPGKSEYQQGDYNPKTVSAGFDYNSLCVDAGNPAEEYNDAALPPGRGGERCDIGAYGGPGNSIWLDSILEQGESPDKSN
jgi:predicted outer membrane repeat protein